MAKIYINTHDPIIYQMYDREYTDGMFGDDFMDEYGVEVPEELYVEYLANLDRFWKIQLEILKIVKPAK